MREVKDPEVRKAEIMESATKLFYTKGYIHTTMQDIIDDLHISRGLVYYHFKSKEAILFSILEKHTDPIIFQIKKIAYDENTAADEKVRRLIESTLLPESSNNPENRSLQETMDLRENRYMLDQICHKLSYAMFQCFSDILKQGNEEGIFSVEYPEETAAFLTTGYTFVANDHYFHNNDMKKAAKYLNAFKQILNETLGMKKKLFEV